MKTKDVAFGGMMIALFMAIGFLFRGNIRTVQTYLEILKTIVVAVAVRYISPKARRVYPIACFASSLILTPIYEALIYNVPSIIGGYIIGIQREKVKQIVNYFVFFLINSLMIVYEFLVFGFFMQTNLFFVYQQQAAELLSQFFGDAVTETMVMVGFAAFMIGDSAFSAAVIFILSQLVIKKLKGIMT